jgi:GNAT superfamily N-acetyltransferase
MDAAALLGRFDREMRADPPPERGVERAWFDGVLRTTGAYNLIGWWDFPAARAREIAEREAAFFAGQEVEWKLYSHDRPPGLETELAAAAFTQNEAETFLACEVTSLMSVETTGAFDVREARDEQGVRDFAAAGAEAFGRDEGDRVEAWLAGLGDPRQRLFVVYDDGEPVASARLELPSGRSFAGLYGGGVRPAWRGRGVYRALIAARAQEARRCGYRWVTVDALETSRPILERLGFEPLATIRAWAMNAGD